MAEYIKNPISGKLRGVTYEDGKIIDVHIRDTDDVVKVFVPVRHGRWERTVDGAALCTACKRKMNPSQYGYAFCGLCGAKMDLHDECKQDGER